MNDMKIIKAIQNINPYLLFLPLLIVYIVFVVITHNNDFVGDENKYMEFAENLIKGYYSPPAPDIYLGVGPGYSLFLVPFIFFRVPLLLISITNAIFHYLSVVIIYKILRETCSFNIAFLVTLFWAFYLNIFEYMAFSLPETLPSLLILILFFNSLKYFNQEKQFSKYLYLSGFTLGYLALTKVIFGYVILVMLIIFILLYFFYARKPHYRKSILLLALAMLVTTPYLFYTYSLTGKVFYWSSDGGNNLYWMSTPYENEYGNWYQFHELELDSQKSEKNPIAEINFKKNHRADHELFLGLEAIERDEAYKKKAIENILSNPTKYVENCFSNIGRILFNFPYSYHLQKPATLLRLPFNGTIVLFGLITLFPTFLIWRKLDFSIKFMLLLSLTYFFGSIWASAETRMFTVIVPVLLIWITIVLDRTIQIKK